MNASIGAAITIAAIIASITTAATTVGRRICGLAMTQPASEDGDVTPL